MAQLVQNIEPQVSVTRARKQENSDDSSRFRGSKSGSRESPSVSDLILETARSIRVGQIRSILSPSSAPPSRSMKLAAKEASRTFYTGDIYDQRDGQRNSQPIHIDLPHRPSEQSSFEECSAGLLDALRAKSNL